jgi:hypothetical protein
MQEYHLTPDEIGELDFGMLAVLLGPADEPKEDTASRARRVMADFKAGRIGRGDGG